MYLYAQYIKEREGSEILIVDYGFATYRKLEDGSYYLIDIFVEERYRKLGIARNLFDKIVDIAKADNASRILGSVCTSANGVTASMASILAVGFQFSSQNGNMLYFSKVI